MAVGLPLKTTYADGDVYAASDVNDTNGTINITAAPFAAGKNKIINGDFRFNQRNFTSNTALDSYNFDRWKQINGGGGSLTTTPQTFTLGAAPVAGYEATNFVQCVTASGDPVGTYAIFTQFIEDVRTLAGQTATISFWAKAASGTPKIALEISQNFGTGGSPSSEALTVGGTATLSTSWARYSLTVSIPSISGKTIGTNQNSYLAPVLWLSAGSSYASRASSIGVQNATFQIWGVQVEAGSTATAFQTATGTIQGELAACQRYYWRTTADSSNLGAKFCTGVPQSATTGYATIVNPVPMRVAPTSMDFTNLSFANFGLSQYAISAAALAGGSQSITSSFFQFTASSMTAGQFGWVCDNGSATCYIGFNAEL
jgi:hypothetical protein